MAIGVADLGRRKSGTIDYSRIGRKDLVNRRLITGQSKTILDLDPRLIVGRGKDKSGIDYSSLTGRRFGSGATTGITDEFIESGMRRIEAEKALASLKGAPTPQDVEFQQQQFISQALLTDKGFDPMLSPTVRALTAISQQRDPISGAQQQLINAQKEMYVREARQAQTSGKFIENQLSKLNSEAQGLNAEKRVLESKQTLSLGEAEAFNKKVQEFISKQSQTQVEADRFNRVVSELQAREKTFERIGQTEFIKNVKPLGLEKLTTPIPNAQGIGPSLSLSTTKGVSPLQLGKSSLDTKKTGGRIYGNVSKIPEGITSGVLGSGAGAFDLVGKAGGTVGAVAFSAQVPVAEFIGGGISKSPFAQSFYDFKSKTPIVSDITKDLSTRKAREEFAVNIGTEIGKSTAQGLASGYLGGTAFAFGGKLAGGLLGNVSQGITLGKGAQTVLGFGGKAATGLIYAGVAGSAGLEAGGKATSALQRGKVSEVFIAFADIPIDILAFDVGFGRAVKPPKKVLEPLPKRKSETSQEILFSESGVKGFQDDQFVFSVKAKGTETTFLPGGKTLKQEVLLDFPEVTGKTIGEGRLSGFGVQVIPSKGFTGKRAPESLVNRVQEVLGTKTPKITSTADDIFLIKPKIGLTPADDILKQTISTKGQFKGRVFESKPQLEEFKAFRESLKEPVFFEATKPAKAILGKETFATDVSTLVRFSGARGYKSKVVEVFSEPDFLSGIKFFESKTLVKTPKGFEKAPVSILSSSIDDLSKAKTAFTTGERNPANILGIAPGQPIKGQLVTVSRAGGRLSTQSQFGQIEVPKTFKNFFTDYRVSRPTAKTNITSSLETVGRFREKGIEVFASREGVVGFLSLRARGKETSLIDDAARKVFDVSKKITIVQKFDDPFTKIIPSGGAIKTGRFSPLVAVRKGASPSDVQFLSGSAARDVSFGRSLGQLPKSDKTLIAQVFAPQAVKQTTRQAGRATTVQLPSQKEVNQAVRQVLTAAAQTSVSTKPLVSVSRSQGFVAAEALELGPSAVRSVFGFKPVTNVQFKDFETSKSISLARFSPSTVEVSRSRELEFLRLPEANKAVSLTKDFSITKGFEIFKQPQLTKTPQVTKTFGILKTPQVLKTPEVTKTFEILKSPQVLRTPQVTKTFGILKTPQVLKTPQITKGIQLLKTPQLLKIPFAPKVPTPPKTPPAILFPQKDFYKTQTSPKLSRAAFDVLLKTPKGFKKINVDPLEEYSALSLGQLLVERSTKRSFQIVPTLGSGKTLFGLRFDPTRVRTPGRTSKLPRGTFIERSKFAINTAEELTGITRKGQAALRRGVRRTRTRKKKRRR